ncbi:MAG: penicillin-binding protein 2 [Gammaproteobacteria bacterium]
MKDRLLKNYRHEIALVSRRILFALMVIFVLMLALTFRLAYLQIAKHKLYTTLSKKNRIEIHPIEPNRGLIFDRNGELLAENVPVFSLDIIPKKAGNIKAQIQELQKFIPISDSEIESFYKALRQHRQFEDVPLKLKLTPEEVAIFSVNRYRFPGFMVKARLLRQYPHGKTMAHVIGYVGRINARESLIIDPANYSASNYIGKVGIEKFYENTLHGTVGYKKVEVDARGAPIRDVSVKPPVPGKDIYLTIDSHIQSAAEEALKGKQGAVVAIDPQNGEILALASNPQFDPNLFVQGIAHKDFEKLQKNHHRPLYNRALRGLYPPGSTIKPFVGLLALDNKKINATETIYDQGFFKLDHSKHVFHNWHRLAHGYVDLHKAIVVSSDVYFFWLAQKIGIQNLDNVYDQFGFGHLTKIDLPEELPGLVPTPEWKAAMKGHIWYPGDTLNLGIGQGYALVTPLQLAHATATLAMHGEAYTPHLVYAMQAAGEEKVVSENEALSPVALNNPNNWKTIIKAMHDVVATSSGTGFRFGHPGYTVAAKTGTAQVYSYNDEEDRYRDLPERLRDNSVFIAFAPIDHPKIAVAVVVEHNLMAPNIARKVLDACLIKQPKEEQKSNA